MSDDAEESVVHYPADPRAGGVLSSPNGDKKSYLSGMPLVLQRRVASFLHPVDATNLTESGVAAEGMIVRSLIPDCLPESYFSPFAGLFSRGDIPRPSGLRVRLVANASKEIVHSVTLHTTWKGGRLGNQNGGLYIVAKPRIASEDPEDDAIPCFDVDFDVNEGLRPFDGGRVVAMTTRIVPRERDDVELTFIPREGEVYYLWYRVGGRYPDELHVVDCSVQTFVYDDMESSFKNTFQILHTLGVVPFSSVCSFLPPFPPSSYPPYGADSRSVLTKKAKYFRAERKSGDCFYQNLLLRLVQSGQHFVAAGNEGLSFLMDLLLENGFQLNEATLHASEAILQAYIDELNYDWLVFSIQRRKFYTLYPTPHDFLAPLTFPLRLRGGVRPRRP
jgi:hypothetical protein